MTGLRLRCPRCGGHIVCNLEPDPATDGYWGFSCEDCAIDWDIDGEVMTLPEPTPNTKEQNIAFRKAWDEHVEEMESRGQPAKTTP